MQYKPYFVMGLSVISSLVCADEFIYSETGLEKELREQVACLSAGTCAPDISGYFEQGELSNVQLQEPFFEFSKEDVIASVQLTTTLDVYSAKHHRYENCASLKKVIQAEALVNTDIPLSGLKCNAGLGYSAGSHTVPNVEPTTLLGKQRCENSNCPYSFYYGSNFFQTGDYFPFYLSVTYSAVATPVKQTELEIVFDVDIYADYTADSIYGEIFLVEAVSVAAENSIYSEIAENFTGPFTRYDNWQTWESDPVTVGPVAVSETSFGSCLYAVESLHAQNPALMVGVTGFQCQNSSNDVLTLPGGSGELSSAQVAPIIGHEVCENGNCPPEYSDGQVFKVLVDVEKILVLEAATGNTDSAPLTASYRTLYHVRPADFQQDYQQMVTSLPMTEFQSFKKEIGDAFVFTGKNDQIWGGEYTVESPLSGRRSISRTASQSPLWIGCSNLQFSNTMFGDSASLIILADEISQLVSKCDRIVASAPYVQSLASDTLAAEWSASAIKANNEIDTWQRYSDLLVENLNQRYDIYRDFKELQDINFGDTAVVSSYMATLSEDIWQQLQTFLLIIKRMTAAEIEAEYNSLFYTSGSLEGIFMYSTGAIEKPAYWDEFIFSPFASRSNILSKESAIRTLYGALIDDSSDQTPTRDIFVALTEEAKASLLNELNKSNWFLTEYVAKTQTDIKEQLADIRTVVEQQLTDIVL